MRVYERGVKPWWTPKTGGSFNRSSQRLVPRPLRGFASRYPSVRRYVPRYVPRYMRRVRGGLTPEPSGIIDTVPGEEATVDYSEEPMVREPSRSFDSFDFKFNKKMNRALLFELGTDAGRSDGRHARWHAQGMLRDAQRRLAAHHRRSRQAKTATGRRRPDSPLRTRPLPTSTRGRSARAPVPPARQTGPAGIGFAPWPKLPRRSRCQREFKAGRRPARGV